MKLTRPISWRWGASALVAGTVILVACEGENLFENDQFFDQTVPSVTATVTPTVTSPGSTIQIAVHATDNTAVTRIGYAVLTGTDTLGGTPTLVDASGATKDTTFSFIIPATTTARTLQVIGIAQDASGRRGVSAPVTVTLADSAAPVITINAPASGATLPLNDSVRVNIRVQDPSGIKSIRLRGEATRVDSLGPTRIVQRFAEKIITFPANPGGPLPTDTTITRYLLAIPDSISEPVQILVTADDSLNNTAVASTTIFVGGPRVELRNPTNGRQVTPGGTMLLTAFAVDRTAGIDSVQFNVTGAQTATIKYCNAAHCLPMVPSNDSILINHNYVVGPTLGTVTITATAWNRNRIAGQSSAVSVTVSSTAVSDTARPQVRVSMTPNDRVQLSDVLTVNVAAQDNGASGLRRMGIVVTATPGGTGVAPDTVYLDSIFAGSGRTGLQPATFTFTLASLGFTEAMLVTLPRAITFQVNAFAVDTVGNSGCNVTNTLAALPCDSILPPVAPRKFFVTRGTVPVSQLVTVVPGFSVPLPTPGSRIADLVVDMNPARPRLYLSNLNNNRVDVLCLAVCGTAGDSTFADAVSVGSEPWGMTIDNTGTRLMVANSGGTNISMVNIESPVGSIREVPTERILTPNAVLFDVRRISGETTIGYEWTTHDFSDRPQFVAQDASGIILHSTKPTGSAPDGTVRYLEPAPAGSLRPFESKILYTQDAVVRAPDFWAISRIDSIGTRPGDFALYDHRTGDPSPTGIMRAPIDGNRPPGCDDFTVFTDALDVAICVLQQQGSDIDAHRGGRWNLAEVGLSDTTYVTTSTDRDLVAFGEGGVGPFASVWLWRCDRNLAVGAFACANDTDPEAGVLSDYISVGDLVGNAAERVLGIALNSNGTIGGARGTLAAYFFSNGVAATGDLRLQGVYSNGVANAAGGIALHPRHPDPVVATCDETTLAFIATSNRSIKITDTFHFRDRGEIQIRDNIVGPLRAALPLDSENVGLSATDTILVKLYGLTGAGNAVIINVRRRDLANIAGGVCQ
jgi:hypothetical protein